MAKDHAPSVWFGGAAPAANAAGPHALMEQTMMLVETLERAR